MRKILDTCCVFFHCWRNEPATRNVLRHFRAHYPLATVHMISDGGDDFSIIGNEFGCCYHHEEHIGYMVNVSKEQMHEWLRRLLYCCHESPQDWLLVLEDDVLVRRKMLEPLWPIVGIDSWRGREAYAGAMGSYLFSRHPHLVNNGYGGGGGSLLLRDATIDAIERYLREESFEHWKTLFQGKTASDLWISTIMMADGHQYAAYDDLVNTWKNRRWRQFNVAVVHQPSSWMLAAEPHAVPADALGKCGTLSRQLGV